MNVRGFNLANNHTVSANASVLEWPCQSPNVTVHAAVISPTSTLMVGNKDGFIADAKFAVDCMKSERLTARWDLLDSNQTVLRTLPNATQLISEPYAVPPGLYEVTITASLWSSYFDLSHKTVVVVFCVNVFVQQPLAPVVGFRLLTYCHSL